MNHDQWRRVRRDEPCPICDRPDWCIVSHDGAVAICARVAEGAVRQVGNAGWLHRLREPDGRQRRVSKQVTVGSPKSSEPRPDLANLAARFRAEVEPGRLAWLARDLGVTVASLQRLGVGWCEASTAWAFPMAAPDGKVLGIRLRTEGGRKFAVKGGRDGLFVPADLDGSGLLLIAEGPTDAAALLSLGLEVVGRPNCRGGEALLVALVRRLRPTEVVILADPDHPGLEGAGALAGTLALHQRRVAVLAPPRGIKDARAWVRAGATRQDVLDAIEQVRPVRVTVRIAGSKSARAVGGRNAN